MSSVDSWASWWKARGEDGLRELVMAVWDPIGVADLPAARDEYDRYLGRIARLLREGGDVAALEAYLTEVRTGWMGLEPRPEADSAAADAIGAWYREEMSAWRQ